MNDTHIRRIDLNLLWVFYAVMKHRQLTAAAASLSQTQSAVSHALNRLRHTFEDELFLRTRTGVEPTARALALEPRIAAIVEGALAALREPARFDPSTSVANFRLGMLDFEAALLGPPLIARLRHDAPGLRLSIRHEWRGSALAMLRDDALDMAVGFFPMLSREFRQAEMFVESYAVVACPGHAALTGLDAYCAADHLLVSPAGDFHGIVDRALAAIHRRRHVVATLPLFFPALHAVAEAGLVATVPRRLAERHAAHFGLDWQTPPFAIRPFTVSAAWHLRRDRDPMREWLTGILGEI